MGYGSYILPSGKEAGYNVEAKCEHPGCEIMIHRGFAFACGGDAGEQGGLSCEGYFCEEHLYMVDIKPDTDAYAEFGICACLCAVCLKHAEEHGWLLERTKIEHWVSDQILKDVRTIYTRHRDRRSYR